MPGNKHKVSVGDFYKQIKACNFKLTLEGMKAMSEKACEILGHSRLADINDKGEIVCWRCKEKINEITIELVDVNDLSPDVDCDRCKENYHKLNWRDKIFTDDPFPQRGIDPVTAGFVDAEKYMEEPYAVKESSDEL